MSLGARGVSRGVGAGDATKSEALVAVLVGGGQSGQGQDGNEGLKFERGIHIKVRNLCLMV